MEWFDTCTPPSTRVGVLGSLDKARAQLADAQVALRTALGTDVEWVSVAADRYRARITERMLELRALATVVDSLEGMLRSAANARADLLGDIGG